MNNPNTSKSLFEFKADNSNNFYKQLELLIKLFEDLRLNEEPIAKEHAGQPKSSCTALQAKLINKKKCSLSNISLNSSSNIDNEVANLTAKALPEPSFCPLNPIAPEIGVTSEKICQPYAKKGRF